VVRTENFGFRLVFAIIDFLATCYLLDLAGVRAGAVLDA
jgi:hypothetical protein